MVARRSPTKNYVTGIEYSATNLDAIYFSEGRCTPNGATAFYYQYNIKDHLGNIRERFQANGTAVTHLENMDYYPFGMLMEGLGSTSPANDYTYNGKELNEDFGLNWYDYGARWYDGALGRWWSVDPLGEKSLSTSCFAYVSNNPIIMIDPTGMCGEAMLPNILTSEQAAQKSKEQMAGFIANYETGNKATDGMAAAGDWIPLVNEKGEITLEAEEGDNYNSLIRYFGDEANAKKFLPIWAGNPSVSYQKGDRIKLTETNVFSETMSYYVIWQQDFAKESSYDCKELCRQLVLNQTSIQNRNGGYTTAMLEEFGKDWAKKTEITSAELKFGVTFSYWSYTPPWGDHAAIYFGKDNKGNDYYFSKNGTNGPLVIQSYTELSKSYRLWDMFRTDYRKK